MKKITKSDGTIKFRDIEGADILARHMVLDDVQREEIESPWRRWVYRLKDGAYVHPWFVSYAEPIKKPLGIKNDEPWIHINRKQQTLVLYVGKKPVFATLVSTGIEGHETPLGEFRLRSKRVTATMSDIGEDAVDDRYRIEDVPWTQYFSGSLAIHGTFWHDRFGLQRSHGCVNVSPGDARKLFFSTWPEVPLGWHGISARNENIKTSLVLITD